MDSYNLSLKRGQDETQNDQELDARAYSSQLLKNYMGSIGARKAEIEQQKMQVQNIQENQPTAFQQFNLRPVAALADALTGSHMAHSYTPPPQMENDPNFREKLRANLAREESGLIDDQLNVARLNIEDSRVRDRMDQATQDRDLDRKLKMAMLAERIGAQKETASVKATGMANKTDKLSGKQSAAAGFARRIDQTESIFDDLIKTGYQGPSRKDQLLSYGPNEYQRPEARQYDQAVTNFINATLRFESGAAISAAEFANAYRQYIPRPGDDETTLSYKRANRSQVKENFKAEAQGAYDKAVFVNPLSPNQEMPPSPQGGRRDELKKKYGL